MYCIMARVVVPILESKLLHWHLPSCRCFSPSLKNIPQLHLIGYVSISLLKPNRFKLPEYALYVKELYHVFKAQACFVIAVNESLKCNRILRNFSVLHVCLRPN